MQHRVDLTVLAPACGGGSFRSLYLAPQAGRLQQSRAGPHFGRRTASQWICLTCRLLMLKMSALNAELPLVATAMGRSHGAVAAKYAGTALHVSCEHHIEDELG